VSEKIKSFQKLALVSTLATYFLIFLGGLVRVSGAGLGCPDWPKCFGRWIPPLTKSGIPPGIDASAFNVTLAWIEYINRLAGMITGLLILALALLAIKNFRDKKQILIPSLLAAVMVAFQGWYGSIVVKSQLMPHTVSLHLLLALIIVSLLIYVLMSIYHINRKQPGTKEKFLRRFLLYLWILVIIQILLGTETRSQIEIITEKYPLLMARELLDQIGLVNYLHSILGVMVAFGTGIAGFRILKMQQLSDILKQGAWLMTILMLLQILLGLSLQTIGISPFLQIFHLWIASLFVGVILIIYTDLIYQQG
jgi:cytochrome c oxidase assembly protein subunit 15